ncbi:hypothetical protein S7711_03798 [Stachybotrys chartarum IBT 7711]|uniref:Alkaline ceramidase 3 n=1 Tax=Stachybotrys chartarum (strain CBS 109288 / IBT 7711) TaxID=1280523 RepID=A0A084AU81_STACB|nr:hypothetical protein S7711_03798 [Stachybotrys chartarum IBT 7711]KFA46931.1 hypothetical protein S40293_03629 [Stachybotrys chartarum IBT 40293]KFA74051.1 hypothetical protein S40288_05170 [Stachybotrys chartarum IBT 40288]
MGHHNRHFAGDRYALSGAWSPPTSSANFCEEDYLISYYVAEFINSLTNFTYVYYALRYMYGPGSRGLFAPKWDFMSISLFLLGVASFLFHATLRHFLQYADELGMLLLAWSMCHGILVRQHTNDYDRAVNIAMAIFFPLFSAFYVYTGKIVYHASVFTFILLLITARGWYLLYLRKPRFPADKLAEWKVRGRWSLGILLFGYFLWHVDLEMCEKLREIRGRIGLPWAFLLEMHGWWHIFTAMSAAWFMDILREVQIELKREKAA